MTEVSTREKLLGLVDDVELICKELLESLLAPKPKRLPAKEQEELTLLLIDRHKQIKETLQLASEQADIENRIEVLREEMHKQDECLRQLQKSFKDAETILSTAVFQAKQKLDSISRAGEVPVSSEDLIRYAHRISASNAVCAPLNWEQGDPRRPYPTDLEMRLGFLGRPDAVLDAPPRGAAMIRPGAGVVQHAANASLPGQDFLMSQTSPMLPSSLGSSLSPAAAMHLNRPMHHVVAAGAGGQHSPMKMPAGHHATSTPGLMPHAQGGQFSWHGAEMNMTFRDGSSVPIETAQNVRQNQIGPNQDDVEVMSTDSSSSSSTDSN